MHAFNKIIPFVAKGLQDSGSAILIGSHGRIPIKKEAFQPITPNISSKMVFVDGGNGEILRGPNVSLQFIRLYATLYDKNVRVERELKEFYLAVLANKKGLDLEFQATLFSLDGEELEKFSFDAFDPALCWAGRRAEPYTVAGYVRKLLEVRLASDFCVKLNKNDIIVRDGDLEARGNYLEESMRSLRTSAEKKGIIVLGISKTSTLCTDSGNSALFALRAIAPSGAWSYYAGTNVSFVKLHSNSRYVFRCDVFPHDKEKLPLAWASLAANSADPAFLGYPYGLLDADKFAQVPKDELAQLRARFAVQSREAFSDLESTMDAHGILDSL